MTRRWSSGARPGRPAAAAPGEDSNGTNGEYCSGTDTESLFDPAPLKDLADMTGLSASYFSRAFKASTGMAPYRWYLAERVRRAQGALLETNDSLAEVALASGFADQSHFTRAFRTITGASPGAWRKSREA